MAQPTFWVANWKWLLLSSISAYVVYHIAKFIRIRCFYNGLPSPDHSFMLGNLKVLGELMKKYPPDSHPQSIFTDLARDRNYQGIFYMDLYPFSESLAIIIDPELATQVQHSPDFHRHPFVDSYLGGLVGTKSVFSTKGTEWQRQRAWFSPAFSLSHLLTLIPGMIEECLVFKEKLTKYAVSGEVFSLNNAATLLTIDVIARSVGDLRLKSQTEHNEIQVHFSAATSWTAASTAPWWQRLRSRYMLNYHTKKLDKLLGDVIKEKYSRTSEDGVDKSILDLALKGYMKDSGRLDELKKGRIDMNKDFMKIALDNAKTFLIGGHDTTAILVTYSLYYLSIYPQVLARVRDEHDQIFGSTFEATINTIAADPYSLNKIPFTLAVLKEVLRLHPIGFTVREGVAGSSVTYNGRTYPTAGHMVAVLQAALHRDPKVWSNPNDFEPDRFLQADVNESGSWQPFEKGRNCIGQQLALLEAKVIVTLTARYFDFEAAFNSHGLSIPGWGGRAYQMVQLTAKPKDGIPVKVKLTNRI